MVSPCHKTRGKNFTAIYAEQFEAEAQMIGKNENRSREH